MLYTLLEHSVPEISVEEFQLQKDSFQLLDAREKAEYNVSHIKNARWVGYKTFDEKRLQEIDRTKPVVVYCAVGYRSEKIAEKLKASGFEEVYNLYGGIFEWANNAYPLYKGDSLSNKIHAYDKKWGFWLNDNYQKVY